MQMDMEECTKELIREKFRDRERGGRRYLLERATNVSKTLGIRAHLLLLVSSSVENRKVEG